MNTVQTRKRKLPLLIGALLATSMILGGCLGDDKPRPIPPPAAPAPTPPPPPPPEFSAEIQRTEFGIPHIMAEDYKGLGYGLGYAFASDNICSLAREIVVASGTSALNFEPSARNITSDVFYTWYNEPSRRMALLDVQEQEVRDAIQGYAAGYSRYLRDTGVDNIDPACAGEPWVTEITEMDLAAVYGKGNLRGGLSNFVTPIVLAQPPSASAVAPAVGEDIPAFDLTRINVLEGGSNAYALGSESTENGSGMLYGNPHEPWYGVQRFYQFHLTIPGEIDVMGAGQQGQPFVNIGFNKDVAWSHTVSTAKRFTLYQLQLVPGDDLKYRYTNADGEVEERDITREEITIDLPGGATHTGAIYNSHFGPMLAAQFINGALPSWGTFNLAFAIRDAASENPRGVNQWYSMNKATSSEDLLDRMKTVLGLPFVNTIAADRDGNALYADMSTVPHVTSAQFAACVGANPALQALAAAGIPGLDGSTAACEWGSDEDSPQEGIFGGSNLPALLNTTYSTNSNDSYWMSNPDEPLNQEFSPLLRRNLVARPGVSVAAAAPRLLRTRMGVVQVQERLSGEDGLGGNKFSLRKLQEVGYSNRNYAAELVLDDVLADCEANALMPVTGGGTIDATEACEVLGNWDRANNVGSRGAHVFREFSRNVNYEGNIETAFSVPFDEADPVNTPRGFIVNESTRRALGDAIQLFVDRGVALDEQLGNLQFETVAGTGERIPMHGGRGQEGVFNVIFVPGADADGNYTPVTGGPTYMQTVTWDADGPVAEALLGQSQSADATNPFSRDQTRRYSEKNWIPMPFSQAEIAASAIGEKVVITE
ncbi:penicillin acylase family protein [Glaciecola sp. XM2]|uniref:penicillin acylase family protein n=1 Tax=Glaciecola sp. XM2 TaxID=1914931 RepID=UPI001BDEBB22|nr:penicillin acylase family protein [Glaciecola sp. XM2]MBT1449445.1 penicillin acylase family protein [Glaciecola sp. XM2]